MRVLRRAEYPSARERFVAIAADMEMGYYLDPQGLQWDARPFVISQCLRSMGYADSTVDEHHNPIWWPGQDTMRRMVALKVMLRQAQARPGTGDHPWLAPLLAATVDEVLRRLYVEPKQVAMRELVDLTTKLARLQSEQRTRGELAAPGQGGEPVAYQRVTETILQLPPEEQERARAALERAAESIRRAIPAPAESA